MMEKLEKVLVLDFVSTADRLEMLFQFEREFKSSVGRYSNIAVSLDREYFTLNIDAPVFRDRKIDIVALIERARNYYHPVIVSDEGMIKMLRELGERLGRILTMKDVSNEPNMPSHAAYRVRFSSFEHVLELAGFIVERKRHKIYGSKEEILDAIRRKAEEMGRTPGRRNLAADPDMPSFQQIKRECHSLNEAIIEAGLTVNKFVVNLTDEERLDLLYKKGMSLGRAPTIVGVDVDPDMPNACSCEKRFGDYNKAVIKSGLKLNKCVIKKRSKKASE